MYTLEPEVGPENATVQMKTHPVYVAQGRARNLCIKLRRNSAPRNTYDACKTEFDACRRRICRRRSIFDRDSICSPVDDGCLRDFFASLCNLISHSEACVGVGSNCHRCSKQTAPDQALSGLWSNFVPSHCRLLQTTVIHGRRVDKFSPKLVRVKINAKAKVEEAIWRVQVVTPRGRKKRAITEGFTPVERPEVRPCSDFGVGSGDGRFGTRGPWPWEWHGPLQHISIMHRLGLLGIVLIIDTTVLTKDASPTVKKATGKDKR
ncbi:hypothetical protein B0H34DRAFT_818167 [Crassisporium funariophilum]|nr:hypothetical protein B0H34DRAFT_818167 [Crassisporium funariophilum]